MTRCLGTCAGIGEDQPRAAGAGRGVGSGRRRGRQRPGDDDHGDDDHVDRVVGDDDDLLFVQIVPSFLKRSERERLPPPLPSSSLPPSPPVSEGR